MLLDSCRLVHSVEISFVNEEFNSAVELFVGK